MLQDLFPKDRIRERHIYKMIFNSIFLNTLCASNYVQPGAAGQLKILWSCRSDPGPRHICSGTGIHTHTHTHTHTERAGPTGSGSDRLRVVPLAPGGAPSVT